MPAPRITTPAGFAPAFAIGYSDPANRLVQITEANPLPVALAAGAGQAAVLAGTQSSSGVAGPFTPTGPAPIAVSLSGDWQGEVRLKRSVDGGATLHDLRVVGLDWGVLTQNGVEQIWSESDGEATFWLEFALTSGSCIYRVSQ